MTDARRVLGQQGEALAAAQLAAWGWQVRETNWRCRFGEIDIVAQDAEVLVLVEVRTRRGNTRYGSPEESVDWSKQVRLARLGEAYVQAIGWDGPWRIDVVAIELDAGGQILRLAHYPNATEGL